MGGVALTAGIAVGGVALAGYAIYELKEHFEEAAEAGQKTRAAFEGVTERSRRSNDQLRVSNDTLEIELQKLKGVTPNGLALSLDEARLSADELATSLAKDVKELQEVAEKQGVGGFKAFISGQSSTTDIQKYLGGATGAGGFAGKLAADLDKGREALRAATTEQQKNAAQTQLNATLAKDYADAIQYLGAMLADTQKQSGDFYNLSDNTKRTEELQEAIRNLSEERDSISLRAEQEAAKVHLELERAKQEAAHKSEEAVRKSIEVQKQLFEADQALTKAGVDQAKERTREIGVAMEEGLKSWGLAFDAEESFFKAEHSALEESEHAVKEWGKTKPSRKRPPRTSHARAPSSGPPLKIRDRATWAVPRCSACRSSARTPFRWIKAHRLNRTTSPSFARSMRKNRREGGDPEQAHCGGQSSVCGRGHT